MVLLGCKGPEIAEELGMSCKGVESIRNRPEFKIRISQLQKDVIARMDEALFAARVEPMWSSAQLNSKSQAQHLIEKRELALHVIKHPFPE